MNDTNFEPKNDSEIHNHPQWWVDLLKKDWPDHWQPIIQANNQKPPLWVRTRNSEAKMSGTQHPYCKTAWLLDDTKASTSSELQSGQYSVQDAAAQYAAHILNPKAGDKILDACAAPGGKSCHLLEIETNITLDILEKEKNRLSLVSDNLRRLNLNANRLIHGDATTPNDWFQQPKYDKILLDVPCSAAGVVRRNPDIKLLRKPEHLKQLTQLQQNILQQIAPLLKVGGDLLYVTCSVFRSENERQIKKFLKHNSNFKESNLSIGPAEDCLHGQQIITGTENMDGFYYCMLTRVSE